MSRWPSGLERWLGLATGRSQPDSNPAAEKLRLAIPFTPLWLCQLVTVWCLSEETLNLKSRVGIAIARTLALGMRQKIKFGWNVLILIALDRAFQMEQIDPNISYIILVDK